SSSSDRAGSATSVMVTMSEEIRAVRLRRDAQVGEEFSERPAVTGIEGDRTVESVEPEPAGGNDPDRQNAAEDDAGQTEQNSTGPRPQGGQRFGKGHAPEQRRDGREEDAEGNEPPVRALPDVERADLIPE